MITTTAPEGRDSYFSFESVADRVMARVARRRLILARLSAAGYGLLACACGGLLLLAASYTASIAAETGFSQYLSLVISNGADLAGSWSSLMLSVVESAPVMGALALLASLVLMGVALVRLVHGISRARSYRHALA
jgi:hypothetical protein